MTDVECNCGGEILIVGHSSMSAWSENVKSLSGWWFGWHQCNFPINIGLGIVIPIDELIFFRGVAQPPTSCNIGCQMSSSTLRSFVAQVATPALRKHHMGLSMAIGVPPKLDGLYGKIPLKWMIWGYPHFRKCPYILLVFSWKGLIILNQHSIKSACCRLCCLEGSPWAKPTCQGTRGVPASVEFWLCSGVQKEPGGLLGAWFSRKSAHGLKWNEMRPIPGHNPRLWCIDI